MFLSVVSVAEIRATGSAVRAARNQAFANRLEDWLRADRAQVRRSSPDRRRRNRADVGASSGEQLGFNSPDLIIAATAWHHDLVVVTRNLRHFDNAGVQVLDPYRRLVPAPLPPQLLPSRRRIGLVSELTRRAASPPLV